MSKLIFARAAGKMETETNLRASTRVACEIQTDQPMSANLAALHARAERAVEDGDLAWAEKVWAMLAGIDGDEVRGLSMHIGYVLFSATGKSRYENAARAWERKLASRQNARLQVVSGFSRKDGIVLSGGTGWGTSARWTSDNVEKRRYHELVQQARKAPKKESKGVVQSTGGLNRRAEALKSAMLRIAA